MAGIHGWNERQPGETNGHYLARITNEALGAASTCWVGGTGDAEFDTAQALEIGEELRAALVPFIEGAAGFALSSAMQIVESVVTPEQWAEINRRAELVTMLANAPVERN